MSEKLSKMTSDLKRTEDEKMNLTQQFQQIEQHRDLLLDKVGEPGNHRELYMFGGVV